MILHLVRICGLIILFVLCAFYPFLPGEYDGLAVPLSAAAQAFGLVGLVLVPVGISWLVSELWRKQPGKTKSILTKARGYYFALASTIAFSIVVIAVSLGVFVGYSLSLGLSIFALWLYVVSRLTPKLKSLKNAETENFNPAPLYLIFIPCAVFILQLTLAASAVEFSRNRAIARSAELISDIEQHRAAYGRYPISLLALHKDYKPSVTGIEKFYYEPNGTTYNLSFEQPRFLTDVGVRELVVYNKLGEHTAISHAAWILDGAPEELQARQGWSSVKNAPTPHWKYFWFD